MKTIKLLSVLLLTSVSFAQVDFGKKEYFTFSVGIDPTATIERKSPNLVAEIELVEKSFYIKAGVQILPALEGGYIDYAGGAGINITSGIFEEFRYYGGVRLGVIKRESYSYPLFGFEGGIDYNISESTFIGLRSTYDKRTDFEFWGGETEYRLSGFIRLGVKF